MNARDYFYANVLVAVEMEDEYGYRWWEQMHHNEADEYIHNEISMGYYFSDIDFCEQTNTFCTRVLKLAKRIGLITKNGATNTI